MAYVFRADVYCDACGRALREAYAEARGSEDSEEFPQGYAEQFAETDSPQHCGECGEYLAQPLTSEGVSYVAEAARAYVRGEHAGSAALAEWCADLQGYHLRGMGAAWVGAAFAMLAREHCLLSPINLAPHSGERGAPKRGIFAR
jgi:hypothetical protein